MRIRGIAPTTLAGFFSWAALAHNKPPRRS
jgi:hypothetical protein